MITATVQKYGNGIKIEIIGHAEYDNTGRDIVCAGVSALCMVAAITVRKLEKFGLTDSASVVSVDCGNSVIVFTPKEEYYDFVLEKLEFLHFGLSLIEKEYPSNIVYKTDLYPDLCKEGRKEEVYAV